MLFTRESRMATLEHLFAATGYVADVLETNCIAFALMGGLAFLLMGGHRGTCNVDIAIDSNMKDLLPILAIQPRPILPHFVGFTHEAPRKGSLGAPDELELSSGRFAVVRFPGQRNFPILDLANIMASKLAAFFANGDEKDFQDLRFLIVKFGESVHQIQMLLNKTHCRAFLRRCAIVWVPNGSEPHSELKRILGL
ncbi:hypothetical protein CPC735_049190 [Coccidioides posadasii C735 delta SOWgp]|uniref:Uncharacterized protein n=2 Tax=Coccidioides posadasii TaxID=199306 RepID=A0A0J6F6P3_COCPO|nr:hypothetical protein CPC735_049190 [Coccidioides posadasii C735 delta SOWgp]EER23549.1 hypothetical protein CPC735_049190 [Coccidioides posadasii C735 delta SOWgp]KMM64955.1 hypothetical protein CPAG_01307 [Coccidioides posadasii RMSCC 3488]|eukprot:XP_003065694.1 hypothetical protein CPC735_049190 [Coccidioides posadasii C735 delta SOWgp]